ncbi:MAG: hypothetical protein JNM21_07605 [Taibaiella sp.]|nr:hypothetical protein [Taibaiella sp.]
MHTRYKKTVTMLLLCFSLQINAQKPIIAYEELNTLQEYYKNGQISKEKFLDSTRNCLDNLFYQSIFFQDTQLVNYLEPYKAATWSSSHFQDYKLSYYTMLMTNARLQNSGGLAMYYADKLEQLSKNENRSLAAELKAYYYINIKKYEEVIKIYHNTKDYFNKIPCLISQEAIDAQHLLAAFYTFNYITLASAHLNAATDTKEVIRLAKEIRNCYAELQSPIPEYLYLMDLLLLVMQYNEEYILCKNLSESGFILKKIDKLLQEVTTKSPLYTDYLEQFVVPLKIDYHLSVGNNSKAFYYINRSANSQRQYLAQNHEIKQQRAQLYANNRSYTNAYENMKMAYQMVDSERMRNVGELNELLYIYKEAEDNKHEMVVLQREKRERNILIFCISSSAFILIAAIYSNMKKKQKEAKALIQQLNISTNLQIAEMEAGNRMAQKRMGMELHDNLASTLAGITQKLAFLYPRITDGGLKKELTDIERLMKSAYTAARKQSHDWVSLSETDSEQSFEKRINTIIGNTLPEEQYQKEILVDEGTLPFLSISDKIEVLRIIQEALTNILKHAKASKVSVLLYRDTENVILQISDNGKGFKKVQKLNHKSLGLHSIYERAEKLHGRLTINSSPKGSVINIQITARSPFLH